MCPSIGVLRQRITLLPFGAFRETFLYSDWLESVTLTLCKWLHDSQPHDGNANGHRGALMIVYFACCRLLFLVGLSGRVSLFL